MEKVEYVTKEGLLKMQKELERLELIERPKISRQIAEARDKGDLSENAEYDAAKEAQGFLELRISDLKKKISLARLLDSSQIDHSKVSILSKVKIKNLTLGGEHIYSIVPEGETDLALGKISVNTPIAIGLLGKKKGEVAKINLPNDSLLELKVLEITAQ